MGATFRRKEVVDVGHAGPQQGHSQNVEHTIASRKGVRSVDPLLPVSEPADNISVPQNVLHLNHLWRIGQESNNDKRVISRFPGNDSTMLLDLQIQPIAHYASH